MTSYSLRALVVMGAITGLAACGGDKSKTDSTLAADSTLNRDLQLAGTDTAAKPQLTDVPKSPTKAPAKTAAKAPTAKAPTAPAPKGGTIAAGTQFSLRTSGDLCTNTNKVGDTFTASLTDAVAGTNGISIPAGSIVTFTVSKLNRSENTRDPIEMVFAPTSIAVYGKTYALDASVNPGFAVDKVKNQPTSATAKKIVGGAAVGAIAGQLLGKNPKSTVIGAAAGAAAGAGVAAATTNYEGCVRNGTAIVVTLSATIQVTGS